MALYSLCKIMVLCALFQAAAASHAESPSFEVVSGSCTVKGDGCVLADIYFGACVSADGCVSTDIHFGDNQDCVIKQNTPFQLDVRSFDVEPNADVWPDAACTSDFLKVNGVKYCGPEGPHGVTPAADSELVWHITGARVVHGPRTGFKICPVSRHSRRATLAQTGP